MNKPNALTGWLWIKEGFALFRKQPAELLTLFFSCFFFSLGVTLIPLIGPILPVVLTPVYSLAFMEACRQIEQGQRVYPILLLTGFRSPRVGRLLLLGLLYLAAITLALLASSLVDGGAFLTSLNEQSSVESKTLADLSAQLPGMLFSALVYLPALMGFWFAAPLIAWMDMPLGKALFFSFFAVQRAGKAFTVYGLAWMLLSMSIPYVLSLVIYLLVGPSLEALVLVLAPVVFVMAVIGYASFYPTYTHIFGKPEASKDEAQTTA